MSLRRSSSSSLHYSTPTGNGGILDSLITSLLSSNRDLTLSESELDRLISDAILQETRDRNASGSGSRSGSGRAINDSAGEGSAPDPSKAASTNKTFLAGVIKGVEGHNRAVIKRGLKEALEGEKRRRREAQADAREDRNHDVSENAHTRRRSKGSSRIDRDRREDVIASSACATSRSDRPQPIPSKMDKYFTSSYDPSLDIAPEHSTHQAQQGKEGWGLIEDGGWDTLLDRARASEEEQQQEAERRRQRRKARRKEAEHERSRRRVDRARDGGRDSADGRRRHRARSASPQRSTSPRSDHDHNGERRHPHRRRDARSASRSSSRSPSRDRLRKSRHRDRRHPHSRDDKGEESHRSRHSRRERSPSKLRSASPERRRHSSHRHHSGAAVEEETSSRQVSGSRVPSRTNATVQMGASALDTKYAPRGSVREWDLGKNV